VGEGGIAGFVDWYGDYANFPGAHPRDFSFTSRYTCGSEKTKKLGFMITGRCDGLLIINTV
jgi:hypothetical protein